MTDVETATLWEFKARPTRVEWKASEGTGRCIFAEFGIVDRDGDVTIPGAFKDGQSVAIAAWGHNWGVLPVGEGVISQDGQYAYCDFSLYLDTTAGADHYKTLKRRADRQQWSYGFDVLKSRYGQQEGADVRYLEGLDVHECSPVMIGAGPTTRTTALKGGLTLADEVEGALAAILGVTSRSRSLADLRTTEGKTGRAISASRRERLAVLLSAIRAGGDDLEKLLAETEPTTEPKGTDTLRLRSEFVALRSRLTRDHPAIRI